MVNWDIRESITEADIEIHLAGGEGEVPGSAPEPGTAARIGTMSKIDWKFDRRAARRKFGYKCQSFTRPKTRDLRKGLSDFSRMNFLPASHVPNKRLIPALDAQ